MMSKRAQNFIGAVFANADDAHAVVKEMINHGFIMDQVSILYKAGGQGDDFLGIAYTDEKERFRIWGTQGALWGSVGGLLASAAGLVLLPGIGPVFVAGPLIDALAGAAVGAGIMTSGAVATHLSIAMRRIGIPANKLDLLHEAIMNGDTVLLMHCGNDNPETWQQRLSWKGADPVFIMP